MPDKITRKKIYTDYLIKNSLECICASDETGFIVEFNPAAEQVFGYSKSEIQLLGPSEMFATEKEYARVSAALEERGKYFGEVVNKRKNGEIFVSYLSANVVFDENGSPIGTMGVSRDISREKELIREVERSNREKSGLISEIEELSQIATSITNGIVITDVEGRIKWCNHGFTKISGYTLEELKGYFPSQVIRIPHFYQEDFKRLTSDGPNFKEAIQVPHYTKSGDLYWILVESTPVYNSDGELTQIIEVCTEITAQKRAEIALVESEQNFRKISETISDAFYLYNIFEQEYEYMSPKCFEILGVDDQFFYSGKSFNDLIFPEDKHIFKRSFLGLKNKMSFDIEYRIIKNGEIRWIHERGYPIEDADGKVIKTSGVCADITEEKYTRELVERQNIDIQESISYARLIQEATLTEVEEMKEVFPESFVLFRPKGELSGDFYMTDIIRTNSGLEMKSFIVADCTGHGVPGAILSILCNSLIKQTFTNPQVNTPGQALDTVRNQLIKLFNTKVSDQMRDGMDIGFGLVDEKRRKIFFAGANMSCVVARGNGLLEITGDRQHVGYSTELSPFTDHTFNYQPQDTVYLFTDGFVDQFGGAKNKRYMSRRLYDLIAETCHLPMREQEERFTQEFESWKGANEQTDDMTFLAVRL